MATFSSDSFTGTSGTELSAYNSLWVRHTSTTGVFEIGSSNRAYRRASPATTAYYYLSVAPNGADYDISADILYAVGQYNGVTGRSSSSVSTLYMVRFAGDGVGFQLVSVVSGSFTTLGTSAITPDSLVHTIKLSMSGTTIKGFLDGVEKISVTNSAITAAGFGGLRSNAGAENNYYDNFLGEQSAGGGASYIEADFTMAGVGGFTVTGTKVIPGAAATAGTSLGSFAGAAIIDASVSPAGVAAANNASVAIATATATFAGASIAAFEEASTYPQVPSTVAGEVLGSEVLALEVLSDSDTTYLDADFSMAGMGAFTASIARVMPATQTASGLGSMSASASAISLSVVTSAGVATATLPAVRVVPGVAAASGLATVNTNTGAIKASTTGAAGVGVANWLTSVTRDAQAVAAGISALTLLTEALKDSVFSASGLAASDLRVTLVAGARASAAGAGVMNITAAEMRVAAIAAASQAQALFGGLGLARTIEGDAIQRPPENRAMSRAADDRQMTIPAQQSMTRDQEHRSMEVNA